MPSKHSTNIAANTLPTSSNFQVFLFLKDLYTMFWSHSFSSSKPSYTVFFFFFLRLLYYGWTWTHSNPTSQLPWSKPPLACLWLLQHSLSLAHLSSEARGLFGRWTLMCLQHSGTNRITKLEHLHWVPTYLPLQNVLQPSPVTVYDRTPVVPKLSHTYTHTPMSHCFHCLKCFTGPQETIHFSKF